MTDDLLQGGNAGKWSYRYGDPRDRFALTLGLRDPYVDMRDPWWLPPRDRCAWSLEIVRERTREIERTRQLFVTIDAAIARERPGGRPRHSTRRSAGRPSPRS